MRKRKKWKKGRREEGGGFRLTREVCITLAIIDTVSTNLLLEGFRVAKQRWRGTLTVTPPDMQHPEAL